MIAPEPFILLYRENSDRPGNFDLVKGKDEIGLTYFKLSQVRKERIRLQGAVLIMESWNRLGKQFFTGLVQLKGTENVLFGNHRGTNSKNSFILLIKKDNTYQLHYFPMFCPRTISKQAAFLINYFRNQIKCVNGY